MGQILHAEMVMFMIYNNLKTKADKQGVIKFFTTLVKKGAIRSHIFDLLQEDFNKKFKNKDS